MFRPRQNLLAMPGQSPDITQHLMHSALLMALAGGNHQQAQKLPEDYHGPVGIFPHAFASPGFYGGAAGFQGNTGQFLNPFFIPGQ